MNNFLSKENNKYLENLLLLILQEKEIKEYMEKQDKILDCYLINNDMMNIYLKNEKISDCMNYIDIYKEKRRISNYSDLYNEKHINNIIKIFHDNNVKVKKIQLLPIFLLTENMRYNGINIPYNFYILKQELFYKIFGNASIILKDFILYKVLITKEGIFIWNDKIEKIIVYYLFLNKDKFNENKFSKVFIFKTKEIFFKEVNNIKKSGRIEYFKSRNFQIKNGYYNLNYDGKIIGQYINIYINDNFESKNSNNTEYYYTIDFEKIKELDKKKILIINIFLSNLLTCLSKIKILKDEFIKRMKSNDNNFNNIKYILINKLIEFITNYNNGNDDKIIEILNDFHNIFKKKIYIIE